jgi:competence protein ComEA
MAGRKQKRQYSIAEWFDWNRGEQRGMLVMIFLISLTILYRVFIIGSSAMHVQERYSWENEVSAWLANQKREDLDEKVFTKPITANSQEALFSFDPNTLDDDGWKKLGFSPGQIRSIRKYLNGGGAFRVKGDVAKMYVIDDEDFARIEPFILLPDVSDHGFQEKKKEWKSEFKQYQSKDENLTETAYPKYSSNTFSYKRDDVVVELNSADTSDLKQIRGIGSWMAKKITEHRNKLGGFYDVEQLLDIYRMTPEKLDTLKKHFTVDQGLLIKRDINKMTEQELSAFPYLNLTQSKALIAYRDKHGPFKRIEDVGKCVAIDEQTLNKLKFYFDVH